MAKKPKPTKKPTKKTEKKLRTRWTIMVFMGASVDLPNMADLTPEAEATLKQMKDVEERFRRHSKPTDQVNTFVQVHGRGVPQRYYLEKNLQEPVRLESEQNSANGSALTHFIRWALKKAPKPSPSRVRDYHMLVIWGHAYQFTIAPVATKAGIDGIDFSEVTKTFVELQKTLKKERPKADDKLDIIGFDSCDLATIEMSYQLERFAHYSLATQIGDPLPGWPYGQILDQLKKAASHGRPMTPSDLGVYVVRQYCGTYEQNGTAVSLTLLNLDRAEDVFHAAQALAIRLVDATSDPEEWKLAFHLFFRSQTWLGQPFVDVADLCLNLWRYSSNMGVVSAAARLGDLLVRPGSELDIEKKQPFILEHGRNAHQTARLTGVSLYAPHVALGFDWEKASESYLKFAFARDTAWGRYVELLAREAM